ncbi:type II toxin-antitoxin system PemK/MazF family toxin, partial [Neobacillus drentensis]|uniref:type II toxin-antitoxin system PemK/MazF family toxin n=1 Tax=Neobacillus drentensis TaxID=220684 RepID=UPI002FFE3794
MYSQCDIVLIPVPFSDLSSKNQRPVLIISNNHYNNLTEDIVVVAITSQLKDLDYSVILDTEDLTEGELKVTSAIRADKVYSLSKNLIAKKFGHVKQEVLENVRLKINALI